MKTHLIMPMGGAGSRFKKDGYVLPKPIIEIHERPFFYWAVRSLEKFIDLKDITFVVLQEHVDNYGLLEMIKKYWPAANVNIIPDVTPGPVFTCLEGLKKMDDNLPIVFNDCDHMFQCSGLNKLLNSELIDIDGGLVTFESSSPNFSYVQYDNQSNIIGTVEKKVVSNHAICGAYMFRSADLFRQLADGYLKDCPYKESFVSGMYNVMCSKSMKVWDYMVDFHVEFGTPEEYEEAKGSSSFADLL